MLKIKKIILQFFLKLQKAAHSSEINNHIENETLHVGDHTYGIYNLRIHQYKGSEAKIIIGKYCSIAPDVTIITGGIHPLEWISTYPFRIKWDLPGKFEDGMPKTNGNIVIGNDVWIGTHVIILSGIKIGNGAVIATGAVVTKDIPDFAIVGGSPAKILRYRFSETKREEILNSEWWNWSEKDVLEKIDHLNSSL